MQIVVNINENSLKEIKEKMCIKTPKLMYPCATKYNPEYGNDTLDLDNP